MGGFLSRLFGGGKKKHVAVDLIEETLHGIMERSGLDLSFDVKKGKEDNEFFVEFFGEDEEELKDREGQLLDALQLFLTRVLQHQLPDAKVNLDFDCNGFREEANRGLVDLAEKLKEVALAKKKSVYFRALPPKDRKIVHQHLADDDRVRSRSVGDGLYKKIKIFPADMKQSGRRSNRNSGDNAGNRSNNRSENNTERSSESHTENHSDGQNNNH